VRRSPTLRYVTAVSAFTCSKMRPDGFGGMAILITASEVMSKLTNDIIQDFLNEAVPIGRTNLPRHKCVRHAYRKSRGNSRTRE
jgi:galactokinase